MHSWLEHGTRILTYNCLLFNIKQLVYTKFLYTLIIIITTFFRAAYLHTEILS